MKDILSLVARILILAMFAYLAYYNISDFETIIMDMEGHKIPMPKVLLIGGICLLIFGCLLLALGYKVKFGASFLLLYFIPVLIYGSIGDPLEEWISKLAIIGGLLMLFVYGSGKYSVKSIVSRMRS